jgi:hypothetical protein
LSWCNKAFNAWISPTKLAGLEACLRFLSQFSLINNRTLNIKHSAVRRLMDVVRRQVLHFGVFGEEQKELTRALREWRVLAQFVGHPLT